MMINCAVERQCRLQSALLEKVETVMLERIHDKVCMLPDTWFVPLLPFYMPFPPLSPPPPPPPVLSHQIPVVRVHAVKALELLQDPESTVQAALVKLLESDPSPEVRKTVLSVIAITDDALPGEHAACEGRGEFLLLASFHFLTSHYQSHSRPEGPDQKRRLLAAL